MLNNLKPRQQKFVQAYVTNGGNATRAAQATGINDENYAALAGHRMIRNDKISETIQEKSEAEGLDLKLVMGQLKTIIQKGKDSDKIQAIKVWADLTGNNAPTRMKIMNDLQNIPKTSEEIEEMLKRMRQNTQ